MNMYVNIHVKEYRIEIIYIGVYMQVREKGERSLCSWWVSEDTDSVADHDPSSVAILPPSQCTLSKRKMYLVYLQNVFVSANALCPRERCICYKCKKYLSVTEMYCEMYRFSLKKAFEFPNQICLSLLLPIDIFWIGHTCLQCKIYNVFDNRTK